MNTMFLKPDYQKCTFKESTTNGFSAPWTPNRFAQLDFVIAPRAFRNSILDVTARTDIAFNSDHVLVIAKIRIKLKQQNPSGRGRITRYHPPNDTQVEDYNLRIRQHFYLQSDVATQSCNTGNLVTSMKQAAEIAFYRKHHSQTHSYISQHTWQMIEDRQRARENNQLEEEKRLNREIAKNARKDKQQWKIQKLSNLTDSKECWKQIKYEKSDFTPNFYSIKDIRGNHVPTSEKANAIAEYLHSKQWGPRGNSMPLDLDKGKIIHQNLGANANDFHTSEVQEAINKLKSNKAPGPDGAITELFKYLDNDNITTLTRCLNIFWQTKEVPKDFTNAYIASIFKKGDHENPENYRPISLLNTTYKIFAYILKMRLAEALEQHLHPTQFGFRKGRSTVDPLFCLRRITDVVEQGNDPLVLIFLDWEKAFDKINHQKMFQSLRRLNIPDPLIAAIESLYKHPQFQVTHRDRNSDWLPQRTGIRQGCPLSPYLFILTLHVMFEDVKRRSCDPRHRKKFQGINFQELLYADDTLVLAKSFKTANEYLHLIEEESTYLDLSLNHCKCCYIAYNCQGEVRFRNGDLMASTNEAKYLGAYITQTINPKHEIRKRISAAMAILKKLDIFWLKTQCSKKWKLLVYNAVITSKVLYGLETLEPTESASKLLNTFQLRGLRKILRLHTTYIQRQNTNDYVYQRANEIVNGATDGPTRKIKPLTEILEERKLRLLGHVLRRERQHPLHQTTFSTTSALPRETNYRRVGRPRQFWTTNNMEKAWEIIKREDPLQPQVLFDKSNRAMRERIIEQAQLYGPPFSKPKNFISQ